MEELLRKNEITSLELLKEINLFREQEGSPKTTHKDLMIIIETEFTSVNRKRIEGGVCPEVHALINKELEDEGITQSSYIHPQNKQEYPIYILPLSKAKQCLLKESKFVRKAVIAYIEKLENVIKEHFKVPTTFAEALRLAAEQQEKIEQQQKVIELQKPKAEFYDDVVDSKDAIDMQAVAKTLNMGIGRNKLFEFLRNQKVLMPQNQPYQKYVDMGWFRVIESKFNKPNGDVCINLKTVVFQKGLDGIRRLVKTNYRKEK